MAGPLWPIYRPVFVITYLWLIFVSFALSNAGNTAQAPTQRLNVCAAYINHYEKIHQIPNGLLQAISKVESGRKDDTGRIVAWPWTVNANGKGYYFPNKAAAIKAVQHMQKEGIKSIDVGCMQVNLYYHPDAFKTLAEAFDPHKNVAYAAHFLTNLKKEHDCWRKAIAHYHSANPIHHIPYQRSVLTAWHRDHKMGKMSLAAGVFMEVKRRGRTASIDRIRRLNPLKTSKLKLKKTSEENLMPVAQYSVRKVTRNPSQHIRRVILNRKNLTKKVH